MAGERMMQIYCMTGLDAEPDLKTQEEIDFYNKLVKEMKEEEAKNGKPIQWWVPSE